MPKYMWLLIGGGVVTYLIHRTAEKYSVIAGLLTIVFAFMAWKKG